MKNKDSRISFRGIVPRLLTLASVLLCALGLSIAMVAGRAYAGSPEAPSWELQVYKSLSGDGITEEDLNVEHHLNVRVTIKPAAGIGADKLAKFKQDYGEGSSLISTDKGTISRSGFNGDSPVITISYNGVVKVTDKETPVQVVYMSLGVAASHSSDALSPADLVLDYTIDEHNPSGYEVYFNSEPGALGVDGSATWRKHYEGNSIGNLFRSVDQIVVNNHRGTAFKEWKVKKVDAKTGEEIDGTFEFTMKQRLGGTTYNENYNSIMANSGEAVALPYPAEYDVRETTPPDGYVPITDERFVAADSDTFKVCIDSEGNLTVDETTGANVTVDAGTLTITVPNYKYEDYTGDVAITKVLATSSGGELPALIDPDQEYTVKLNLRYYSRNTTSNPFRDCYLDGTFGDVTFERGYAEVTIKDGDTINITGLPVVKDNAIYINGAKETIYDGIAYSDLLVAIAEGGSEHEQYAVVATGGNDRITRTSYLPETGFPSTKWKVVDTYAPTELQQTREITITNTLPVYDVTIRKVDGVGAQLAGAKLQVTDREGNVVDEWTSAADENHTIEGALLAGETYTLTEIEAPFGYAKAADVLFTVGEEGQILVGDEPAVDNVVEMVDEKLAMGDIMVTKKVTGGAGDASKPFNFTATFTDAEGNPIANQAFGEDITDENGQISFSLTDGESRTIVDIPDGVAYEIVEGDYTAEGYKTVVWDAQPEGTIAGATPNSMVVFTANNEYMTTSVDVTKVWDDANNQDGIRPASVTVNLLANGEKVDSAVLDEVGGWKASFTDLPKYAAGKEIVYTVEEEAVEGYTAAVSGTAADGFTVTNTHTPETTSVAGKKIWNDENNKDGLRPESVTVGLFANGVLVDTRVVTEKDGWEFSFTDLPKYNAGREIAYAIDEEVPEGYVAEIDGFTIINSLEPKEPETPEPTEPKKPKKEEPKKNVVPRTGDPLALSTIASLAASGLALVLISRKREN